MKLSFEGAVWYWRGPAPWHFVTVPEEPAAAISSASQLVTYGWGMIPAVVRIGAIEFTTSLWPKDGGYIVPLRTDVRRAEGIEVGDDIAIELTIGT